MIEPHRKHEKAIKLKNPEKSVEEVLRNLNDYVYLGSHEFADFMFAAIEQHSAIKEAGEIVTEVDKGKALRNIVLFAINRFKAGPLEPKDLTREWDLFIILNDEYVLEKQTNEVMTKLGLNEGKFFRKRRYAVKCVTAVLRAIEQNAEKWRTRQVKAIDSA